MATAIAAASGAHRYDRRAAREARALVKIAQGLLNGRTPRGDAQRALDPELRAATKAMETALAADDAAAVKRLLPRLDGIVDRASGDRRSLGREYTESIAWAIVIALLLRAFVVEAFKIPSASMIPTMQIGDFIFVNKLVYGVRVPYTRTKLFDVRGPRRGEVVVFMNPCTPERDFIKRVVAVAGDTIEVRCSVVWVNGKAVPSQYVDKPCEYWDQDEGTGEWSKITGCSHYVDTLGGYTFSTFHTEDRPIGPPHPDSQHDFPRLKDDVGRLLERGSTFACAPSPDRRGPQEKARAQGRLESSLPAGAPPPTDPCAPQLHFVVPPGHFFAMGDNRWNSNDSRSWGPVPFENLKGKAMFIWLSKGPDASWVPPFGLRWWRMGNFVHD
ncbi:MAG TPA: signal peptidase I [Kofleriaceae bacterium]|nr:signal peptidase I [Kofleriaceae bacterium]